MHVLFVYCEILDVKHWAINKRCIKFIYCILTGINLAIRTTSYMYLLFATGVGHFKRRHDSVSKRVLLKRNIECDDLNVVI